MGTMGERRKGREKKGGEWIKIYDSTKTIKKNIQMWIPKNDSWRKQVDFSFIYWSCAF